MFAPDHAPAELGIEGQMTRKRMFDKMIFLGNGEHSAEKCKKLHERLNYALMMLEGMQQDGLQGSRPDTEKEKLAARGELRDAAQDIVTALGFNVKVKMKQWNKRCKVCGGDASSGHQRLCVKA